MDLDQHFRCNGRDDWPAIAENIADDELVGIGVLISFILCPLFLLILVFVGYITGSLDVKTNLVDDRAIRVIRKILCCRPLKTPKTPEQFRRRQLRQRIFERFLLGLSDSQLVTSLAIGLAAWAKRCSLSNYSFLMAMMVVLLAVSSSLYTTFILKHYLNRHHFLRSFRIAMLTMNALLLLSGRAILHYVNLVSYQSLYWTLSFKPVSRTAVDRVGFTISVVWWTTAFVNRIVALHTPFEADAARSWVYTVLSRWLGGVPGAQKARDTVLLDIHLLTQQPGQRQPRQGKRVQLRIVLKAIKLAILDIKASVLYDLMW
jgi:hypothetical protein